MIRRLADRARGAVYVRYLAASVGALAVDTGLFLLLEARGLDDVAASAVGYSVGILVHWLFSSRTVFVNRVEAQGMGRRRQKAQFVLSALAGLVVTMAITAIGQRLDLLPLVTKLCAVVVSIKLTYLLRSRFIFPVAP